MTSHYEHICLSPAPSRAYTLKAYMIEQLPHLHRHKTYIFIHIHKDPSILGPLFNLVSLPGPPCTRIFPRDLKSKCPMLTHGMTFVAQLFARSVPGNGEGLGFRVPIWQPESSGQVSFILVAKCYKPSNPWKLQPADPQSLNPQILNLKPNFTFEVWVDMVHKP